MNMKRTVNRVVLFFVLGIFLGISYQNCPSSNFSNSVVSEKSVNSSSTPAGPAVPGQTTTTTVPSGSNNSFIDSKAFGTFDTNCLNSNAYDACLFWKNPVAQRNSAYSTLPSFGTDLSADQKFGVKLSNLLSPNFLESSHLYVYASLSKKDTNPSVIATKPRLALTNGRYLANYKDDGNSISGRKSVAQLMAYYWLNQMQKTYTERSGSDYSSLQQKTYVDAYCGDTTDGNLKKNAYFTFSYSTADATYTPVNRYIFMGYVPDANNAPVQEMALSAEVYLHEMGHGNFVAAAGGIASIEDGNNQHYPTQVTACTHQVGGTQSDGLSYIQQNFDSTFNYSTRNILKLDNSQLSNLRSYCNVTFTNSGLGTFCKTAQGCIDGINEGQADFHYIMMYPQKVQLGETIVNNVAGGLASYSASRDVSTATAKATTVTGYYDLSGGTNSQIGAIKGEIHGMGSAYVSILWEIYNDPKINKMKFEKAFFRHLKNLTASSTFSTSWDALRTQYMMVSGVGAPITEELAVIDAVFTRKGVIKSGI